MLFSCSKKQKAKTEQTKVAVVEEKIIKEKEKLSIDEINKLIIKKWSSNVIEYSDKTLVFKNISSKSSISNNFIVEFKPDGNLTFEDTTKNYSCGNGMPYFDKATWEFKKGLYNPKTNDFNLTSDLILHIRGGQFLENRFEFKRVYKIKSISENRIELKQINSILEQYIHNGNNFFEE